MMVTTFVLLLERCGVVIQLWFCSRATIGLLFGNHIVDASSLVSFYRPGGANAFESVCPGWCVV